MTTPTNWPNPERPGYPMFPERDGWHMTTHSGATSPTVSFWRASEEVWKSGASSYTPDYLSHPLRKYIGPVLTPNQITEMLAGERDRCLTKAVDEQWNFPSDPSIQTPEAAVAFRACQRIIDEIRNLGEAP